MNKPDLETCTLQEACDYAVFKIVEQGKRCVSVLGLCAYGNDNDNHCAVGWLLDHNNKQLMYSGDHVENLIRFHKNDLPIVVVYNLSFMLEFQDFHDCFSQKKRQVILNELSSYINTTAPQYQQWVEMGEAE